MKTLTALAENIFCEVITLPQNVSVSATELKKNFLENLAEFCNDASNCNYSAMEIDYAKYAICAFIDEYIYSNSLISAEWFSHSLALSEFGDAEAGRVFFERLEKLHKLANAQRLFELYAKCILFGFQGKFRIGEKTELKQILILALSKIKTENKPIPKNPQQKNKKKFSLRRGKKNILITGLSKEKCKNAAVEQVPPSGYKFIFADFENLGEKGASEIPFLDGIIFINPLDIEKEIVNAEWNFAQLIFAKQKSKCHIYMVSNFEIEEMGVTFNREYKFLTEHLSYYLQRNFLDETATKNILSLPKKLKEWAEWKGDYSMPFFPFMRQENPLAYRFNGRKIIIFAGTFLLCAIISIIAMLINKHKNELIEEAAFLLNKKKLDSISRIEDSISLLQKREKDSLDSLNAEFEKYMRSLENNYQKNILAKFPFAKNKTPTAEEVESYFANDGEFKKFAVSIDAITDERVKLNKKALSKISLFASNVWEKIPASLTISTPKTASAKLRIDSSFIDVGQNESETVKIDFPQKNSSGIEITVKTAHGNFKKIIKGEWALLELANKKEISFADKSYIVDIGISIHWNLPSRAIHPNEWFNLELEPNLIGE